MSHRRVVIAETSRIIARSLITSTALLTSCVAEFAVAAEEHPPLPAFRLVDPDGLRIGVFGEKPAKPAPTIFVLGGAVELADTARYLTETGRILAATGWLTVTVELPCHGRDSRLGEPAELSGWAHRAKAGEDLMTPFTIRCRKSLDYLIDQNYTDPKHVAICGTSRGGLCGLHFAAADPRIRVVTCVSPVTNPLQLREFAGVSEIQVESITATGLADRLAGRPIQFTIGNDDARVGTDDCVATARRFVTVGRRKTSPLEKVPVELVVGPSDGHRAIENAYSLAARFILQHSRE